MVISIPRKFESRGVKFPWRMGKELRPRKNSNTLRRPMLQQFQEDPSSEDEVCGAAKGTGNVTTEILEPSTFFYERIQEVGDDGFTTISLESRIKNNVVDDGFTTVSLELKI